MMRDALAHGAMLVADGLERRSAIERWHIDRPRSGFSEPVGPLPAELVAVDGAEFEQRRVQRTAPRAAARVRIVIRPGDVVVARVALDGALVHERLDRMRSAEAADVERPQVEARIAVDDPVRHHPSGAARRGDARREAAAQVEIVELGREPDDRLAIGGDRDRAVDHLPNSDLVRASGYALPPPRRAARSDRNRAAGARDRSRCAMPSAPQGRVFVSQPPTANAPGSGFT